MLEENVPNPLAKNPNFNTHKVFATIGLILIAAILVLAGIWIYVENQSGTKTTGSEDNNVKVSTSSAKAATQSTEKDETADWKIYTSTRDGYSIKYPSDWILIPEKTNDGPYIRNFEPKPGGYPDGYYNLRVLRFSADTVDLGGYTVKEWYERLQDRLGGAGSYLVAGTIMDYKVNGMDAKKAEFKFDETDEVVYLLKDPFIYEINIYPYGGTENKIIQLMLSTFKFL